VKNAEGRKSVRSGKVSRSCPPHSHHELYISIAKSTCADILDDDPMDFSVPLKARIKCIPEDEDDGPFVGEIRAVWVAVDRALRMGQSLYDIFDSSQETWEFYEALMSDHTKLTEALDFYTGGETLNHDMLLLTGIEIGPSHRRQRLGLRATASVIEQFRDHCALVMCQPFPMQFGPIGEKATWQRLYGSGLGADKNAAIVKLKGYWRELGFKEITNTGFALLAAEEFDAAEIFAERDNQGV
jgi:hypothetical protein